MSDDTHTGEKKVRPNAQYKLSNINQNDEELNFRYSREARLSKAPQSVRDLYDNTKKRRFSFLGPLNAGKGGRVILLFSILLLCGVVLLISVLTPSSRIYEMDGNRIEVQAINFEGTIIVVMTKTIRNNIRSAYSGTVDIGISPLREAAHESEVPPVFLHRIFFTAERFEDFRFSLPFEAQTILMVLETEINTLNMRIDVN